VRGLSAKAELLKLAAVMVRSDPPEFVSTTEAVWLAPTGTFPKLMLAGVTASCPALEAPEKDQAAAGLAKLGSVKKEKRRRTEIVWERTPSSRRK